MARQQLNKTKKENIYWYKEGKYKKFAYRYRFYDYNGKRREKTKQGFENERDAELALTELKAEILKGNLQQVESNNLTIQQWISTWYTRNVAKWKVSTIAQYSNAIERHIIPELGQLKIARLTRSRYQEFIDSLTTKYSVSTVRTIHSVFNSAIYAAVEDEILTRNKISKINLPQFKSKRLEISEDEILNEEEITRLIDFVKENESETHYTLLVLLATTGMRKGEALALRWNDIDFDNNVITITRTRDHLGERTAKTENSVRSIDASSSLINHLKKYKRWSIEKKLRLGIKLDDEDHVLINAKTAEPISRSLPNQLMERAFEFGAIKRVTPHSLRHTYASLLISKGIPVTTVAKIIGDTVEVVLKVYAHSLRKKEKEAVKIIDETINF
ncbi:site-specific integrase [Lysinibacillus sp. PLM2]|nr:site-specific integrase [Lysinibacillus sp. PLM2]